MTLNIFETSTEAIIVLARYFVQIAREAINEHGRFCVALSGGHSPRKLYELLSDTDLKDKVDWSRIWFFFGDERHVPHNDPQSNYKMVKEALLDPLHISPAHVFAVNTALEPEKAAADYQYHIDEFFKGHEPRFDLILLGLGDNAHTASLFPHTPVLQDTEPSVKPVWLADQQTWRITFNAPMINNARNIAFLVFGKEKAAAMQHVFSPEGSSDLYPARLIRKKHIAWFADADAAALVSQG